MNRPSNREPDDWPFPNRRYPKTDDPDYLGAKGLSTSLQRAIAAELAGLRDLNVLDVGCGQKPFYPFLRPYAGSYVGTDIAADNAMVDKVCPAERLEIEDEWADVVLCLSVLEHVDDPIQSVRELHRVVKPGGVVLALTHGCFPWHPYPQDHWRWTHTGLSLLFSRHGGFSSVEVTAPLGTMAGLLFPLVHYAYDWASQNRWRAMLRRPLTVAINRLGDYLDRKTPELHSLTRHVTALPELFVVARR